MRVVTLAPTVRSNSPEVKAALFDLWILKPVSLLELSVQLIVIVVLVIEPAARFDGARGRIPGVVRFTTLDQPELPTSALSSVK